MLGCNKLKKYYILALAFVFINCEKKDSFEGRWIIKDTKVKITKVNEDWYLLETGFGESKRKSFGKIDKDCLVLINYEKDSPIMCKSEIGMIDANGNKCKKIK